ncbi:hypothetical protein [Niallia sp. Krafla_26]|uniref:hypothetical protein n=1 Tax=Niallia sp. Krafla_26 TaxID=3064703 RepID=UPI003D178884
MTKYYTENRMMYFEVVEMEGILGKGKYKIDSFLHTNNGHYTIDRDMTEGVVLNSERKANIIAEGMSWAYNWGYEDGNKK